MTVGPRLPGFILLALVVLAAALLAAGFGVGVGVGVFIGLVLGLVAALASMAIGQPASPGISWLQASDSSRHESERALLERHGRDSMRVMGIDAGALRRVIAVGDAAEAGDVRLELTAVELREDGGLATLVAHTRPPTGPAGHFPEIAVSDDAGTPYVAAGQATGGPDPNTARYEIRFAPSPPESARLLTLRVETFFDPFRGGTMQIDGPWTFEIRLVP